MMLMSSEEIKIAKSPGISVPNRCQLMVYGTLRERLCLETLYQTRDG